MNCYASDKIEGMKKKPVINIKRVYDPVSPQDGRRILVDRLWPRGIEKEKAKIDEWLKDIAPSNELRKWFFHDPSKWQEFRDRYKKDLKNKQDLIEKIVTEIKKGPVTILYSAKDVEHNNARVLKEVIEEQ